MSSDVAKLERVIEDVPDGWAVQPLSRLCDEVAERVDPASLSRDLAAHYVGLEHIGQGSGRLDGVGSVADVVSQKSRFRGGDILYGKLRPNLRKVARPDFGGVCSTDVIVFRATKTADPNFVFQVLQSETLIAHAIATAAGTKMPRTHARSILSFEIAAPPLDEQRRIAEVLWSVDEAIAVASQVIAHADEAFEAVLADLFSCYGDASTKLKSYCLAGGLQTGPFGSQLKAEEYVDDGVPVIMPVDLTPNGIDFMTAKKAPIAKSSELARHVLRPGDVLFARRGEIGRCGLYLEGDPVAMCGTGCLRARLDTGKIDPALAYFFIQSRQARDWLFAHAVGATMPNLNTTIIGELPMPDIPKTEQGTWVEALLMLEGTRRINQSTLALYQVAKADLMSDLLSGQVRVPV